MSVGFAVDDRGHGPRWRSWAVVVGLGGDRADLPEMLGPSATTYLKTVFVFVKLFLIFLSCVYVLLEKVDPILPPMLPPIFWKSVKPIFTVLQPYF